jgi:hypothetical protein
MSDLLNKVRTLIRTRHYSYRTEQTYVYWIKQFILFTSVTQPRWVRLRSLSFSLISQFLVKLQLQRRIRHLRRSSLSIVKRWGLTYRGWTTLLGPNDLLDFRLCLPRKRREGFYRNWDNSTGSWRVYITGLACD